MQIADNFEIPRKHFTGARSGKRIATVGKSGSGKTNTLMVMAQGWHAFGWPLIAIDPMGQFQALRQVMPVIVAGHDDDAHVTPSAGTAPALARLVVEQRVSLVLDVSMYEAEDAMAMLAAFLQTFWRLMLDQKRPEPFALLIDEAQEYIPQGAHTPLSKLIIDMSKRGRHKNVSLFLATQRPASVDKNTLTQSNLMIAHRLTSTVDTDVVYGELPISKTETNRTLRGLADGAALVFGDGNFLRGDDDVPDPYRRVQVRYTPLLDEDAPAPEAGTQPRAIDADLLASLKSLSDAPVDESAALREQMTAMQQAHADALAKQDGEHQTVVEALYARHAEVLAERDATIRQLREQVAALQARPQSMTIDRASVEEVSIRATRRFWSEATSGTPTPAMVADANASVVESEAVPVQRELFRSDRALKAAQTRQQAAFNRLTERVYAARPFAQAALNWLIESGKTASAREIARATGYSQSTVEKYFWAQFRETGLLARTGDRGETKRYRAIAAHFFDEQFPDLDTGDLVERLREKLAM